MKFRTVSKYVRLIYISNTYNLFDSVPWPKFMIVVWILPNLQLTPVVNKILHMKNGGTKFWNKQAQKGFRPPSEMFVFSNQFNFRIFRLICIQKMKSNAILYFSYHSGQLNSTANPIHSKIARQVGSAD